MKILWISHSQKLGGAERGLAEAVHGLIVNRHEIWVIVPSEGELASVLRKHGATVFAVPYRWWVHDGNMPLTWAQRAWYTGSHFRAAYRIARVVRRFKPEIMITNAMPVPAGALAAKFCGIPHIWCLHEFGERDQNLVFDLGKRFSFWFIHKMSDKVTVNSKALWNFVLQQLPDANLAIVYYAIDIPPTIPDVKLPSGFKLVLLGQITPGKGQHEAIEAVNILRARGLNVRLTLMGSEHNPSYSKCIHDLIEKYNLAGIVKFLGFSPTPLSYLKSADVVMVCSSNEAFGRVTVEAMKLSRPVVGACAAGTAELIKDGVTGLLYESGNTADLASKIEVLYQNAELRARLGANAREWATHTFTTEACASGLLKIIGEVMAVSRN